MGAGDGKKRAKFWAVQRCYDFFFVLDLALFSVILGMFHTVLKCSSVRWMFCCLSVLHECLTFFLRLLTSFTRCCSSLGVFPISASSFVFSSVSFAAAVSSASFTIFPFRSLADM